MRDHGMLSLPYAKLVARWLWLKLRFRGRLQTDGLCFVCPGVTIEIGRDAKLHLGRWSWIGHGSKIRVHEGEARIGAKSVLGQECTISAFQHVSIGRECIIADRVMLIDFDHGVVEVDRPIRAQGIYKRDVRVGHNVWIGYGVAILRGVTVGDNSVLGTSTIVSKDVPANAVAAGVPVRVIRMRKEPEAMRWGESRLAGRAAEAGANKPRDAPGVRRRPTSRTPPAAPFASARSAWRTCAEVGLDGLLGHEQGLGDLAVDHPLGRHLGRRGARSGSGSRRRSPRCGAGARPPRAARRAPARPAPSRRSSAPAPARGRAASGPRRGSPATPDGRAEVDQRARQLEHRRRSPRARRPPRAAARSAQRPPPRARRPQRDAEAARRSEGPRQRHLLGRQPPGLVDVARAARARAPRRTATA